jgi:dienelactone hydrolase
VRPQGARVSIEDVSRLDRYTSPAAPRAVLLMLHGGQQHSVEPVTNRHASWWRMAAMARSLKHFAKRHDLALSLLQYGQRGWNSSADPAPVRDARGALADLADSHPGVPVVLIGHSMGGRTACRSADDPRVIGVVALAPWLPEGEPNASIAGRHLRVMHGTRDSWTSARLSHEYVERCRPIAASATWVANDGAGHFMFRHSRAWRRFVEDSVTDILDNATSTEEASSKGSA